MISLITQFDFLIFTLLFFSIMIAFTLTLKKLYKKTKPGWVNTSSFRTIMVFSHLLVITFFISGVIVTDRMSKLTEKRMKHESELSVSILRAAIEGTLNKIDAGVMVLSLSDRINWYLLNPTPENSEHTNSVLDRYCNYFKSSVVYLLDTNGTTVATSNREKPTSFSGKNYSFRPYFKSAVKGKTAFYFASGVTSGVWGYYSSAPVRDSTGKIIGVAVIKDELKEFDSIFKSSPATFLIDSRNTIFLSSTSNNQFKKLSIQNDISKRQIFNNLKNTIDSKKLTAGFENKLDKCIIDSNNSIFTRMPIYLDGWSLLSITPRTEILRYRLLCMGCTIALILSVLITITLIALYRVNEWVDSIFVSEKRFQIMFENAPDAIIICDAISGRIVGSNHLAKQWMEKSSCHTPVTLNQFIVRKESDTSVQEHNALSGQFTDGIYILQTDQDAYHLSVSSTQIMYKGLMCKLSFLRDITGIIRVKKALEESEKKYRELTEFLPEAVFETDENGRFTFTNKRGYEIFGYPFDTDTLSVSIFDLICKEDHARVLATINDISNPNSHTPMEYNAVNLSGRTFPIQVYSTRMTRNGKESGICGIAIDLTEKKLIEEELFRKDKLEALGIMAGGIAHDFNNLLTAVWAGVSLLKIRSDKNSENLSVIADIENAIRRGKDLTNQLLTYSKGGAPIKSVVSLVDLARETASFCMTGKHVKCVITSIDNILNAEIDSAQISQVIQNLLINATEAMPLGGEIKLNLTNRVIDSTDYPQLKPGNYIELTISDSGHGIKKEIFPKIFDPFFTTKQSGSGLGLATAFSIVKRHNGFIYAESIPEKGTDFHIFLPATANTISLHTLNTDKSYSGSGSILLMDDEVVIRTVAEKLLSHMGYSVITASNGHEAIDIYKKALTDGNKIKLVILDLTIPGGMGGKETINQLLEIDSSVRALVSSGYSNDPIMANYVEYGFKGVISKPYNVSELNNAIKSII